MPANITRRVSRLPLIAFCLAALAAHAHAESPDFNRDIRPILAENCFQCHGFDEKARKADLRLDVAEAATAARDGRTPIAPGKIDVSEVWKRIISMDDDIRMPPPDSHLSLTDAEKKQLKTWIEQGAAYAGHWSFVVPKRPTIDSKDAHPIDAIVRKQLHVEGLDFSPAADRYMLARRVALDLTGLPLSASEAQAFVDDKSDKAYESLVDRLLASPHFGERMAIDWLDAARYADTNGFSIDGGRHMWLWRDWVIQSFNDNKPYDQFLVEQLAGDLIPDHTEDQLIATGFQRNNMVTHEGGTIPEENLTNYNVDRVKTFGEAMLGLTLACAQCHNHKFDPITANDYYQFYAFFNSVSDKGLDGNSGINPAPYISAKSVIKTDELPQIDRDIAALKDKLATIDRPLLDRWKDQQRAKLAKRGVGFTTVPLQVLKVSTPNRGSGFEAENGNGVRLKQPGDLAAFDVLCEIPAGDEPITGLRVVVQPVAELPGGGWGRGPIQGGKDKVEPAKGSFVLTAICATASPVPGDQVNLHKLEEIASVTANSWTEAFPPGDCLDPRNQNGWSPDLSTEGPVQLTITFAKAIDRKQFPYLTTQLNFGNGRGMIPQYFELFATTGNDNDSDLPAKIIESLTAKDATAKDATATDAAAMEAEKELWAYCAQHADELKSTRVDLSNLEERRVVLTEKFPTMVMDVSAKPRDTFVLHRGDYAQPTVKVSPGTMAALPPMPAGAPNNRLGLAQWLVMRENPLTARVAVNRFWKQLFGTGLVATASDFGAQGQWPSHPDLLDWLAVEFMESGWNTKQIIKQIVMSRTYQQTSFASAELLERDPGNRLLARGPRYRLPAELVRDAALQVSGLLVPRIGGPSVNPYTPGDLWREVSHYGSSPATAQTFVQDHGEKLYRRSLYTYWKRTAPPPNMTAFDAPNREVCTISRSPTTTPLQALVVLNDPQFVEAARGLAERILHRSESDRDRLAWAIKEATTRPVTQKELDLLQRSLNRERKRYATDGQAEAALSVGESPRDESIPANEHAAWMQVAALILNLSECVTRN